MSKEICERCGSDKDVTMIRVNDEPKTFCQNCHAEIFEKKKSVGRPSLGVTKKVSVTLSESNWEWLDEKAEGNRSAFVREAIWSALGNESEWSNYACLGYAIKALENLSYSPEEIKKIVRAMEMEFDTTTVPAASKIYEKSSY